VPALGALIAEPLFLLADSAIVGHLGTSQLAGLALASTVLLTAVGLSIFLAYGSTAAVARRIGAGDRASAMQHGIDGVWLGLSLGLGMILVLAPFAPR
jgi:Na+-driven multidrug efflux pump